MEGSWINEHMMELIVTVIGAVVAALYRWRIARAIREEEAMRALAAGVEEAWVAFGKSLKQKATDGKLTSEEQEDLRRFAIQRAAEIARSRGVDLLKIFGRRFLPHLLRSIVEGRKRK